MPRTAKLFRNGRNQPVRLPAEYRFDGSEVFVRRDPVTGNVILSRRPDSWRDFFELMKTIDVPGDFGRPQRQPTAEAKPLMPARCLPDARFAAHLQFHWI